MREDTAFGLVCTIMLQGQIVDMPERLMLRPARSKLQAPTGATQTHFTCLHCHPSSFRSDLKRPAADQQKGNGSNSLLRQTW